MIESTDQVLIDITPGGRLNPWAEKKRQSLKIAESHHRLSKIDPDFDNKASKILNCGNWLEFRRYEDQLKLNRASFCKYRLCFTCSWRRCLKLFGQTSQVMDEAANQKWAFLFVTLTMRNCLPAFLEHSINDLYSAYYRLTRINTVKKAIHGGMKTLEVTHNLNIKSKDYDTYHPHIHAIWAVRPSYFNKHYINQVDLTSMWQQSMKIDYKPIVHITRANTAGQGHVREVAKYCVKPSHILHPDPSVTDAAVWHLDRALKNRRLISWTGVLKDIRAAFRFDDPETGDLVNVDGSDIINPELGYILETYRWNMGYNQYIKGENNV